MKLKRDIVSLFMCAMCLFSLLSGSFVIVMVNRISPMEHMDVWSVLSYYTWFMIAPVILLALLSWYKRESQALNFLTGMLASAYLGEFMYFVGLAAQFLMEGQKSSFRVTWGFGAYLTVIAWYGITIKCNEKLRRSWMRGLVTFSGIGWVVLLFATGWMNKMAIMAEYFTRFETFQECFGEHLQISLAVMVCAIVLGLPLGYLCYRNRIVNSIVIGILNIVRSVPAIALMIVLVTPLAFLKTTPLGALGVSAFGATPVFCALFLYALFQIVNSLSGALKTIDGSYIKTAKAMGMTNSMIMWKIQIPLILPVLVSGIRVAVVSTFTAASLGTLVGFGGLGVIITMGSSGAVALDMILLGAVPIMAMIFVTNFLFGLLGKWLDRRLGGRASKESTVLD